MWIVLWFCHSAQAWPLTSECAKLSFHIPRVNMAAGWKCKCFFEHWLKTLLRDWSITFACSENGNSLIPRDHFTRRLSLTCAHRTELLPFCMRIEMFQSVSTLLYLHWFMNSGAPLSVSVRSPRRARFLLEDAHLVCSDSRRVWTMAQVPFWASVFEGWRAKTLEHSTVAGNMAMWLMNDFAWFCNCTHVEDLIVFSSSVCTQSARPSVVLVAFLKTVFTLLMSPEGS